MCASPTARSAAGLVVVVQRDELTVVDGNRYRWIQGIECACAAETKKSRARQKEIGRSTTTDVTDQTDTKTDNE